MAGNMSNNANMNMRMRQGQPPVNDRRSRMMEIYKYGFIVNDLTLYLDTHPDDRSALDNFNEARKIYFDAVKAYTKMYGPLLISVYEPESQWCWAKGPMPWEGEV